MSNCTIEADLALCRDAWLDPHKLSEWLAEAASTQGTDFTLTSRLPNVSGRHRILKQDADSLEFDWFVDGCGTKLTVDFESVDDQTRVEVRHKFPSPTPIGVNFPEGEHYSDQVWRHALYQLKSLLETGKKAMTLPWPDNAHTIELEITVHAPVAGVWQFLVNAEQLRKLRLGGSEPLVEPWVGGRYSFGWDDEESNEVDGPGYITEWVELGRLSHSWYGGRDSVITYVFEEEGETTTRIRFKHTGLVFSYEDTWSYKLGWADHLLQIKELSERR